MEGPTYSGHFPKPKELDPKALVGVHRYLVLFCIKTPLKDTDRFLYINVLGSSREKDLDKSSPRLPYQITPANVHWLKDHESSRDCVVAVRFWLMDFYELQKDSQYCDMMDKIVREWFTILNKGWKEVKGMDAISKLEVDTTKNYTVLNYVVEPTIERISLQRYSGRHEIRAAKSGNIEMNSFLNMLKNLRPDHCDWPDFIDETEMFCAQITCTSVGHSLFLNFLGTNDRSKLDDRGRYNYSPFFWRKDWPNYDLVAFVRVSTQWYEWKLKNKSRYCPELNDLRHRVVDLAMDEYVYAIRTLNIRRCPDGIDCDGSDYYSILEDGKFVEPSPCYAEPEDSIIDLTEALRIYRQLVDGTLVVSVKLRRLPDRIRFNDDSVEIYDGIWSAIAKFHIPILVDLTQPLEYKWEEEERTLHLHFKVHETLEP